MQKFKEVCFDNVLEKSWIPEDIALKLPAITNLPLDQQHFLLYIPWNESYLDLVPKEYRDFFSYVLPHLKARTTDVHTAVSLSFLKSLIEKFKEEKINERVIAIALILHDSGWSKLSEQEIALSLGVTGLKLNSESLGPKEKHAIEGKKLAQEILNNYEFYPALTKEEIELILNCILFHDKPCELSNADNEIPLEMKILADLDHIWSFTHENFWQDTLRKGVNPEVYWNNLKNDMDSYFVTKEGLSLANRLLDERKEELESYQKTII